MKTTFTPGRWLAICDLCGFRFYNTELRKDWRGLMVDAECFETRHPQDFLRVPTDNPAVPWTRPESADVFIPVVYICTPEGSTAITGLATVGCSLVGSSQGNWNVNRSAVVGIAITGIAAVGHS